jgi:uncharacterized membrane protein
MKKTLRAIFPFFISTALWYLSDPRFNPFGALAIVPVFYYMFCDRAKYWQYFGFFICFLLDFNAGTKFLFCSAFLLANAANILFGIFEMKSGFGFHAKEFGLFFAPTILMLLVYYLFLTGGLFSQIVGMAWLFCWIMILYVPLAALFGRIGGR